MPDWRILAAILAVGVTSYLLRAGGFVMVSRLSETSVVPRLLRLAPGNLFIAFAAAGWLEGGMPSLAGSLGAFVTMAVVKREWAALAVGFSAAALTALIRGLLTPL